MPTASGLSDYDYPCLSTLSMGIKTLNQIETINKIPIPPEVMEHFKRNLQSIILHYFVFIYSFYRHLYNCISLILDIKCHCMMGLFPEIGRAWLTIDSDIYVSSLNVLTLTQFYAILLTCHVMSTSRFGRTNTHET